MQKTEIIDYSKLKKSKTIRQKIVYYGAIVTIGTAILSAGYVSFRHFKQHNFTHLFDKWRSEIMCAQKLPVMCEIMSVKNHCFHCSNNFMPSIC